MKMHAKWCRFSKIILAFMSLVCLFCSFSAKAVYGMYPPSSEESSSGKRAAVETDIYKFPLDYIRKGFLSIERHNYMLKGFEGKEVVYYALFKPLSPVSSLTLHPEFISVLIFPYKVQYARASIDTSVFEVFYNAIFIRPRKVFERGNMVVLFDRPDGSKQVTSIVFKTSRVEAEPVVSYVVYTPYRLSDPVEVLEAYRADYGHYPESSYTLYRYNGVTYMIKKGAGNIHIAGATYGVTLADEALPWLVDPATLPKRSTAGGFDSGIRSRAAAVR